MCILLYPHTHSLYIHIQWYSWVFYSPLSLSICRSPATSGLHMTRNRCEGIFFSKLCVTTKHTTSEIRMRIAFIRWEILCVGTPVKNINCYSPTIYSIFENLDTNDVLFFADGRGWERGSNIYIGLNRKDLRYNISSSCSSNSNSTENISLCMCSFSFSLPLPLFLSESIQFSQCKIDKVVSVR